MSAPTIPTTAPPGTTRPVAIPVLLTLALLNTVAPLATDLYLSAFPRMTTELSTSATGVQLTLTAFLLGLAVGQLVFGPLSDRFGRIRPLVAGSALLVLASVACVLAPTVEVLIGARLVQGLCGAAGLVIGRALITDLTSGAATARAMSLMMLIGGVAPVLAPLLGSTLVDTLGWRGILAVVAVLAVVMLAAVLLVLRPAVPADTGMRPRGQSPGLRPLAVPGFIGYLVSFTAGFGVLMAYISASPFVYQTMIGFSPVPYGLAFGLNAVGMMICGAVSARVAGRIPPQRLIAVGIGAIGVGALSLLALVLVGAPAWTYAIALFVSVAPIGLLFGNATALALGYARSAGVAGTASALLGAVQFGVGAAVSPLVSIAGEHTALPLAIVMVVMASVSAAGFAVARSAPPAPEALPERA